MFIEDLIKKKIHISDENAYMLRIYIEELWKWNQKINLVGVSSIERVLDELLIDSLVAKDLIPNKGCCLDIGSGAGFPAIPLKIMKPDVIFHLVEARTKKVVFLRYIIRKIGLKNIKVIENRMECIKNILFSTYDVVTFKGINLLYGLALSYPYIKDGIIINFQGKYYKDIIAKAKAFTTKNRLKIHLIKEYQISQVKRALIIFKKYN